MLWLIMERSLLAKEKGKKSWNMNRGSLSRKLGEKMQENCPLFWSQELRVTRANNSTLLANAKLRQPTASGSVSYSPNWLAHSPYLFIDFYIATG